VVVSWTPSVPGSDLRWTVEGPCLWAHYGSTLDDGSLTLGAESFEVRPLRVGEDCDVDITLDRARERAVDPDWIPGSTFRAVQRRAVRFVSTSQPSERGEPASRAETAEASRPFQID
jgi:hypothetical protein